MYDYCRQMLVAFVGLILMNCAYARSQDLEFVRAGSFQMGDDFNQPDERPSHVLYISALHVDSYEVTLSFWDEVAVWAEKRGYEFNPRVRTAKKGPSWSPSPREHPMNMVSWFDVVKWCNARSEREGRMPAYYEDAELTRVYRKGDLDLVNDQVNWRVSGYRLPTEAEWEKAARGGIVGTKYPWGDSLDGSKGNYRLSGDPFDNASTPVGYFDGSQVIIEEWNSYGGERYPPQDMGNGYGLYDLLGNVNEWCWDWYDPDWYGDPATKAVNPFAQAPDSRGPVTIPDDAIVGGTRVLRGGSFQRDDDLDSGNAIRLAYRHQRKPVSALRNIGFRCVRSAVREPLWSAARALDGDVGKWMNLEWFGTFYQTEHVWIFHLEHGWVYPQGEGSYDNWIYLPDLGWLWTNGGIYPYLYSPADGGTWLWYDYVRDHSGWFYNFRELAWMRSRSGS